MKPPSKNLSKKYTFLAKIILYSSLLVRHTQILFSLILIENSCLLQVWRIQIEALIRNQVEHFLHSLSKPLPFQCPAPLHWQRRSLIRNPYHKFGHIQKELPVSTSFIGIGHKCKRFSRLTQRIFNTNFYNIKSIPTMM